MQPTVINDCTCDQPIDNNLEQSQNITEKLSTKVVNYCNCMYLCIGD